MSWLPELPDCVPVGRGVWQSAGAGTGADRRELSAPMAGDETAQAFLCGHSAIVREPRASCAVHSLLSALGTAVVGPCVGRAQAPGDGGTGRAITADR